MRDSAMNRDRRDEAFERAVRRHADSVVVYWLAVRYYPNAEVKRLTFWTALERDLALIALTDAKVEIIGQGEEVGNGKA